MNEQFEPDGETSGAHNANRSAHRERTRPQWPNGHRVSGQHHHTNGHASANVTVWTFADIIFQRWYWLVLGGLMAAAGFFALGSAFIKPKFTAQAQLLRYETPGATDFFGYAPLTAETFAGILRSPELLRRVGERADPPIPPEKFLKQTKVEPEPDSDMVRIFVAARSDQEAVDLVNFYAAEAVEFTRAMQAAQAAEISTKYLTEQVKQMNQDIFALQQEFRGMPASPELTNKLEEISSDVRALNQHLAASPRPTVLISKLQERLQTALAELSELTAKYHDIHPLVQGKLGQIQVIESQIASASTNNAAVPGGLSASLASRNPNAWDPELEIIRARLASLEDARIQLANRQREAELYAKDPPGMVRLFAPATLKTVETNMRPVKIGIVTIFGGMLGMIAALALVMLVELADSRLKTADDVKRVTRLPVLTTLGDLRRMEGEERAQWAFRTWTMLQGRLGRSANSGLICGITSSTQGEGRSTWISLLAEAASLSGFRVLTIATRPSPTHVGSLGDLTEETLEADMKNAQSKSTATALTTNVLASPAQVTDQLTGPNSQPVVHIPLPGWVWNLDRRKQWRAALNHWRRIDNLVILVELPPASVAESVLLASNLPNLVWLTDSGAAQAGETRAQLETLRHARCNLVGAVLNREPAEPLKRRFPRWLTSLIMVAAIGLGNVSAQESDTPALAQAPAPAVDEANPSQTPRAFSVVSPAQRARWQERLTLGPGDVLTFALYGEPTSRREEVFVPPDGMMSYLEATNIRATGLTIDELRVRFEEELGKFRRAPRVIITPVTFKSKKYFVLGKVTQKGAYVLDRPITVMEAIARAQGFEHAYLDRNVIDMADFQRSFLIRDGRRIPLNFDKLFGGDLSQNIPIEPGDYLYFPSANVKEVYVLGEVILPGPVTHTGNSTIVGAISARGGFNDRAFKSRVLVVRGSLNNPELFVVDTMAITSAREKDFKLQAKDIIYVHSRPFIRAEELLDLAATAFIQAVVTSWVGTDVIRPQ